MERLSPRINCIFFFNDTATTEIYTLSLHDALPILDIAVGAAHIHAVLCQCGGGKNGPYGHQLLDARNHVVIEKVEECRFVVWSAVGFRVAGAVLLGILGFESPRDFLCLEVDGVEPALMRANVQGLAGNRRRREHRPMLEVDGKKRSAGLGVESMEQTRIRSCEINSAIHHGGGRNDPRSLVRKRPPVLDRKSVV